MAKKNYILQYIRGGKLVPKKIHDPSTKKPILDPETNEPLVRMVGSNMKGVLFAESDGEVVKVGWSLCNKKDKFNKKVGVDLARTRADKHAYTEWGMFVNNAQERMRPIYKWLHGVEELIGVHRVPHSIKNDFIDFMKRAQTYFKDNSFPQWAKELSMGVGLESD